MAQDFGTIGQKGLSAANPILDSNFDTLISSSSGSTAPSDPVAGRPWWDTANSQFKVYDGSSWVVHTPQSITSTDNAIPTFDGTSGSLQNTGVSIDDSDNMSGIGNLTVTSNVGAATVATTGNITTDMNVIATGNVSGVDGTFTGDVSGVAGTFTGNVSGADGDFTGDVSGDTLSAQDLETTASNLELEIARSAEYAGTGILVKRTASDVSARQITSTEIDVTNGNGVSGDIILEPSPRRIALELRSAQSVASGGNAGMGTMTVVSSSGLTYTSNRVNLNASGIYHVSYTVVFEADSTGYRQAFVNDPINGGGRRYAEMCVLAADATEETVISGSDYVVATGTTSQLQIIVKQGSGSALDVGGTSSAYYCRLNVHWVGPA